MTPIRQLFDLNPTDDESLPSLIQRANALHGWTHWFTPQSPLGTSLAKATIGHALRHQKWALLPQDRQPFVESLNITGQQVESATLWPWTATILRHRAKSAYLQASIRIQSSCFCGPCLASGWSRRWLLPTTTDCLRHNVVLAHACPQCESPVSPLSTGRAGTAVVCGCGFVLNRTNHAVAEDEAARTQHRLGAQLASDRDPHGQPVAEMYRYLEAVIPVLTQIGTYEALATRDPADWDTTSLSHLLPGTQPWKGRGQFGAVNSILGIDPDPRKLRVLVHHAHRSWDDVAYRRDIAERAVDANLRWTREYRSHRQHSNYALDRYLAPLSGAVRAHRAASNAGLSTSHLRPETIPAVVPFWEVDPTACPPNERIALGASIAALLYAQAGQLSMVQARAHLGLGTTCFDLSPSPSAVRASLEWFNVNPLIDLDHRRDLLSDSNTLFPLTVRHRHALKVPETFDPDQVAATYWIVATCGRPASYPHFQRLEHAAKVALYWYESRAARDGGRQLRELITAGLETRLVVDERLKTDQSISDLRRVG